MIMQTELTKLGTLADKIKEKIPERISVDSLYDVRMWIEDTIKAQGYEVLFPPNITPGSILSHSTPLPQDSDPLGKEDFTTIDLGIKGKNYMVDTAITLVHPQSEGILTSYRECMQRAIHRITTLYQEKGKILIRDVTRIVQQEYCEFLIVEECCAHEIKGLELYHRLIPMGCLRYSNPDAECQLGPGSLITLEPHVALGKRYHLRESPGRIVQDGSIYKVGDGKEARSILSLNCKGFYQEHMLLFGDTGVSVVT